MKTSRDIRPKEDAEFLVFALRRRREGNADAVLEAELGEYVYAIADVALALLAKEYPQSSGTDDARSLAVADICAALDKVSLDDPARAVNYLLKCGQCAVKRTVKMESRRRRLVDFVSLSVMPNTGADEEVSVFEKIKLNSNQGAQHGKENIRRETRGDGGRGEELPDFDPDDAD